MVLVEIFSLSSLRGEFRLISARRFVVGDSVGCEETRK